MSEHSDETRPVDQPVVRDEAAPEPTTQGPERHGPSGRPGWRDRAYGIKGVAAVAVAALLIGGGAGAAIHAAVADGDRDGRPAFMRDGGPGERHGGGLGGPRDERPRPPEGPPVPE